ncbi:helix-turn-helix domain-containing protein [Pseudomonas sp. UMAB-40]|uniref:helix-turn-helix domain-containing protein n=1 Tax=Pseudomonas sp. UMAB-40 TaxID=1365407 RepID=UPI001C57C5EE|nr:helix-turn-helix domain-containing protein [Pseudomonas sp. UMAB-40]
MTAPTQKHPQLSVLNFKRMLKERLASFETDPNVLADLAYLRSVRRSKWDVDLDYYGNRKHHSDYKVMREAKAAGTKVPRWNFAVADTSSYPLKSRIRIERETLRNHRMHIQLRRSIVQVLSYLIDKVDLVTGACLDVRKDRFREIYIDEIAAKVGLGKRTVQRALSNLSRHGLINRGVALICIAPAFYKAIGIYSAARAMVASLRALIQQSNYRGARVLPEQLVPHKNFHRFNHRSSQRPSVRRLLDCSTLAQATATGAPAKQPKVPRWNSQPSSTSPPPKTGPPPVQAPSAPRERAVGNESVMNIRNLLKK